ncbi:MAG: glycosyltransferase [Pseudomonadota bacterium]
MRLLFLSQEPPFDADEVATGNALRSAQLVSGLEAAGHTVSHAWLDREGGAGRFRSADELRGLIQRSAPDAMIVAYWELLELLPFEPSVPVVLDFLAPRPLEALFESPERTGGQLQRLRIALGRVDAVLVGSTRQKDLLAYTLLEAGFDLRVTDPVLVVPLAGESVDAPDRPDPAQGMTLVAGGVRWPWRQDTAWREAVRDSVTALEAAGHSLELLDFGGAYRWAAEPDVTQRPEAPLEEPDRPDTPAGTPLEGAQPLRAYRAWSGELAQAHIGLELGDPHIERAYSQSFRSVDFLRHGLPIMCSSGQPLAQAIETSGAGWVVDHPDVLAATLEQLVKHPDQWRAASAAARTLCAERHGPATAIKPLLTWLKTAAHTPRLPGHGLPDPTPPVLGIPPLRERLGRRYRLARRIALHRLIARGDRASAAPPANAVVMVSRHDLFPTDHGAAVKIVETARGLSRNGQEVLIVTHERSHYWRVADGAIERRALPAWLRLPSRGEYWTKLDHYTRDLPESNAFLYLPMSDGSFFWRTLWVAATHRAAWLQAEFPAYALPCIRAGDILQRPTVLVEHNVEYARLKAQIPELTDAQYARFKAIEIDLCNRSDAVVCVSDNDRQRLAADGVHAGLLHTIPHGIDLEAFDEAEAVDARAHFGIPGDAPLLAYHGTFAYPPNRDALQTLADEILPRLSQRGIEAHVLAIGHQPPHDLHPAIHCTGSVEQVAPWLKAANLAVVPLREGGGTRMKIIDDFAAGLPVVATSKGIEGIPATDEVAALIRDDWPAFADAIARLVHEPETAAGLAAAGRNIAETVDWRAIGARYLKLVEGLPR